MEEDEESNEESAGSEERQNRSNSDNEGSSPVSLRSERGKNLLGKRTRAFGLEQANHTPMAFS